MIKQKMKKIFVASIVAGAILSNSSSIWATTKHIKIPELGNGYTYIHDTRSKQYSYAVAGCESVCPVGNTKDTFTKIRVKLFYKNSKGEYKRLSKNDTSDSAFDPAYDSYILNEEDPNRKVYLRDDMMNVENVYFGFSGNSVNYRAKAEVAYNAK